MTEYPDPYDNTQQPYRPFDCTHYANYQTFPAPVQEQTFGEPMYQALRYQKIQPEAEQRLSKAEALDIVAACKRWLIVGSVALFGLLAILIGGQIASASTQQSTMPTTNPNSSFGNNASDNNVPSSGSGGFFQQQQGGSSFGNNNGQSQSQSPFSSTRTS